MFFLRCLSNIVILVSVRLKRTIKTPRSWYIIRRAERQLLKECIRSINNTLELYKYQSEAYISQLKGLLDQTTMEECQELIKMIIEARHNKTMSWNTKEPSMKNCQGKTGGSSNSNCGCSKPVEQGVGTISTTTNTRSSWVKNLSSTTLKEAQEHLLAHGPNFAIASQCPTNGDYIALVEQAYSRLN